MTLSLLPITIVPTKSFQKKDISIKFSHSLVDYWRINTKKPLIIAAGTHQVLVNIETAAITKDEIFVSDDVLNELMLPLQERAFIAHFIHKENMLFIGPIIGLLTEVHLSDDGEPHFRSIHGFCKELQDLVLEVGGFFYVFSLNDYSNGKIAGYTLQNGRWEKSEVPLPDVIYNRIHSRRLEASGISQQFKDYAIAQQIPIFNHQFLSKEKVHSFLFSEEFLLPYLPETMQADEASLKILSQKHEVIFIKPIHGSQGRNIIKVSKDDENLLAQLSSANGSDSSYVFHDYSQFYKWIHPFLTKRAYIAQAGIPLMKYKNNQLDFRILCHRNFQNRWKATSAVARISADHHFVSNIARGGELMKPVQLLSTFSNRQTAIQQLALMKELAVETATIISQNTDGYVGELGIDIGVDEGGKLWIIEVNAKPSKNFEEPDKKIRPSAKALLEYCTFLAFSNKEKYRF
ncbi:YheC/YheD family protein [Cytobacillus depressus]|uniref:YheC/YheD family protein n=1 Tax=Cytobacillus depressus TaxID=1602942 RepID=A0A6L3V990_9BACI|nr:YheC/YheD family protein [Cytobacillus depressus]KAB2337113.1 YheC/YheD family protein [Cytobacillus depressus]